MNRVQIALMIVITTYAPSVSRKSVIVCSMSQGDITINCSCSVELTKFNNQCTDNTSTTSDIPQSNLTEEDIEEDKRMEELRARRNKKPMAYIDPKKFKQHYCMNQDFKKMLSKFANTKKDDHYKNCLHLIQT